MNTCLSHPVPTHTHAHPYPYPLTLMPQAPHSGQPHSSGVFTAPLWEVLEPWTSVSQTHLINSKASSFPVLWVQPFQNPERKESMKQWDTFWGALALAACLLVKWWSTRVLLRFQHTHWWLLNFQPTSLRIPWKQLLPSTLNYSSELGLQ